MIFIYFLPLSLLSSESETASHGGGPKLEQGKKVRMKEQSRQNATNRLQSPILHSSALLRVAVEAEELRVALSLERKGMGESAAFSLLLFLTSVVYYQ